jgi:hypothetical protein
VRRGDRARSVGWINRCIGECQHLPRAVIARTSRMARRLRHRDR